MPRAKLTPLLVQKAKPQAVPYMIWDSLQRGFALRIEPSGYRSYKVVYRHHNRPRWFHIGAADAISLADARKFAAELMLEVIRGKDPQAERAALRSAGTFEEIATRYREEYAKKRNRSWLQADYLVRRHLLSFWGKLPASNITRADVKAVMARIDSPSVANQTLAAASAIFSWAIREEVGGIKVNPCAKVARHDTKSRERVLSDGELPLFWMAFDSMAPVTAAALKVLLLTGQRPGEVCRMRREHLSDGWWTMPGAADPSIGWPGTKNSQTHRVWLPQAAQAIIAERGVNAPDGFVFGIKDLQGEMRIICKQLGVDRATPHDLRRTHGSTITALGFGREAMNRVQNHREGGIADVYDRHKYAEENKRVMEAVASYILTLVEGREASNVLLGKFAR
jgi:integrase